MLESTSFTSLEELSQLLKTINERLTFIEKVVLPSRVTKEELHASVSDAKIFTMRNAAALRTEIAALNKRLDELKLS